MKAWRKSSYSGTQSGSNCVEVAALAQGVGLRDSKAPDAGHLTVDRKAFRTLLAQIKK